MRQGRQRRSPSFWLKAGNRKPFYPHLSIILKENPFWHFITSMLYAMFGTVEFHNRSTRPPTSRHRPALPTRLPTNSQRVRPPRLPLALIHRGRSRHRQPPAPPLRSSTSPFQATPPRPDSPRSRERRSAPAPTIRPLTGPARSARSRRRRPDLPRAGT